MTIPPWRRDRPVGKVDGKGLVYLDREFLRQFETVTSGAEDGAEINNGFGYVYQTAIRQGEVGGVAATSPRTPVESIATSADRASRAGAATTSPRASSAQSIRTRNR